MQNGAVRLQVKALHIQHTAVVGVHHYGNTHGAGLEAADDLDVQPVAHFHQQV